MKRLGRAYYPGTQIGITEYNWGAEGHINGATAQADILGIFGREGLDLGDALDDARPRPRRRSRRSRCTATTTAPKSTFGDTSVSATGPEPRQPRRLRRRSAPRDGALTVMVINKVTTAAQRHVNLANFTAGGRGPGLAAHLGEHDPHLSDVAAQREPLSTTLPAQSITLFVVPAASAPTPSLSVDDVTVTEGNSGTTSTPTSP